MMNKVITVGIALLAVTSALPSYPQPACKCPPAQVSSAAKPPQVSSAAKPPQVSSAAKPPQVSSAAKPPQVSSAAKPPQVSSSAAPPPPPPASSSAAPPPPPPPPPAASSSAAPPPAQSSTPAQFFPFVQTANFDNTDGLPLLDITPINVYQDILWQGMSLVKTNDLTSIAGIKANSPPNYAAFSTLDVATLTQGQPAMSVNYADSAIDHFDLKSFYYGCAVGTQLTVIGVPTSCKITITGYSDIAATQKVAEQTFEFKTGNGLLQTNAQMIKATVSPSFKNLKQVNFAVTSSLLVTGLIDSVGYTVYSPTNSLPTAGWGWQ